jgi:hypothetical protein
LGNLAGLKNVQIVKKLYRPVLTFSLPIIIGLYFLNEWVIRISIQHKIKLADFTNGVLNLNLKAPPGRHSDLRLITPLAVLATNFQRCEPVKKSNKWMPFRSLATMKSLPLYSPEGIC